MKPILCLDFDGVLHSYSSGWQGAAVIPDPPVPGWFEFIAKAADYFDIAVFSSRSHQDGGRGAMMQWLRSHGCPVCVFFDRDDAARVMETRFIYFPLEKPAALVTIDDRAITFTGEWPSIADLLAFKPWNKRG